MSLTILCMIFNFLAVIFCGILFVIYMKVTHFNPFALVFGIGLFGVACVLVTLFSFNIEDKLKSDYRECETVATYDIYDISYEGDTTIIHYLNENKELKHIKSSNVKIYYDLNDDHEPYMSKVEYWRLFFYWTECEVHIKE